MSNTITIQQQQELATELNRQFNSLNTTFMESFRKQRDASDETSRAFKASMDKIQTTVNAKIQELDQLRNSVNTLIGNATQEMNNLKSSQKTFEAAWNGRIQVLELENSTLKTKISQLETRLKTVEDRPAVATNNFVTKDDFLKHQHDIPFGNDRNAATRLAFAHRIEPSGDRFVTSHTVKTR